LKNGILENDFLKEMKQKWSTICMSAAILIAWLSLPNLFQAASTSAPTAYELIEAVNAYRLKNGLPPYAIDSILMTSAQTHAEYLASQGKNYSGHIGIGGTDADARAAALGYPQVPGLDINENWASVPLSTDIESLLFNVWGDPQHTHTLLHPQGQHIGVGVAVTDDSVIYVLDVAAYWGDAGLTQQPTSAAYPGITREGAISQYIAPVEVAEANKDGKVYHHVLQGQTLWNIAKAYGVTIEQICQLNGITSESLIYEGQKLLIKIVPTPFFIPSPTMELNIESKASMTSASVVPLPTSVNLPQNNRDTQFMHNRWIEIAILALAVLGCILIFFGQRSG